MDSFEEIIGDNKFFWTACHECESGGNGDKSCNRGGDIVKKSPPMYGCWAGIIMQKFIDDDKEIKNRMADIKRRLKEIYG